MAAAPATLARRIATLEQGCFSGADLVNVAQDRHIRIDRCRERPNRGSAPS